MRRLAVSFVVLSAAIAIAFAETETDPLLEKARAKAMPVAKQLVQTLEGRLTQAMQEDGPVAAIKVCKDQAVELTETVREATDISYLKRVGVRIRNSDNHPDPYEKRALQYFLSSQSASGAVPEDWVDKVKLPDGTTQVRYYRAIVTQARCLLCHGPEELMPEMVRTAIDQRYPKDAARGFNAGDLRGLLVVGMEPEAVE